MIGNAPHVDDDWLAKAMRDSDRSEDIRAIARLLFSRRGQKHTTEEPVRHYVVEMNESKLRSSRGK